ncbi:RHS repeat-associated core domain-containing protein [Deltaproteobacteria bacterium TL4]
MLYQFTYDSSGYLTQIEELQKKIFSSTLEATQILRDETGKLMAIVTSQNKTTSFELNGNSYLSRLTTPQGDSYQFHYTDSGLMDTFTDAKNQITHYTFDHNGRLRTLTDAAGGIWQVESSTEDGKRVLRSTSPMGRSTFTETGIPTDGSYFLSNTTPAGEKTTLQLIPDGTITSTATNGTVSMTKAAYDSRWENQALILQRMSMITPIGIHSETTLEREISYSIPEDPRSLELQTDLITINGRTSTQTYNAGNKTQTTVSAEGRKTILTYNEQGKIVSREVAGMKKEIIEYDQQQRIRNITRGDRTYFFKYSANGEVESVTNPLLQTNKIKYNANGLPVSRITPDLYFIQTTYDRNGNVSTIQPPGRTPYTFEYNAVNLPIKFMAPAIGTQQFVTQYDYNLDRQLELITFPDGKTMDYVFEKQSGRLLKLITPRREVTYAYLGTTEQVETITTSESDKLTYRYDGNLLKEEQWLGVISGKVNLEYNNDFQVISRSVNGGSQISFTYDKDGLLTNAGLLTLSLDSNTGAVNGTTLGQINSVISYNEFGELAHNRVESYGSVLYETSYLHDKLGRITQKTETLGGQAITYKYEYDAGNRIKNVYENELKTEQITYDSNGNRSNYKIGSKYFNSTFDKQDRLTWYAGGTYQYTLNGDLKRKTTKENLTTQYDYDVLGNLRSVTQPDGQRIEYLVDGKNRRIGKKVEGILTQGFLYKDQLNPIVELDGNGHVMSRFIYADQEQVPSYMVKEDKTYSIISDHLGSVRLVIDSDTGDIVQRMDYGTFGNVIQDTNPGFQPFGFAGGLYDTDTKLVRFGARDYDPEIGRWTTKDPIGFNGGDMNLYAYVGNNPVNAKDPQGTCFGLCNGHLSFEPDPLPGPDLCKIPGVSNIPIFCDHVSNQGPSAGLISAGEQIFKLATAGVAIVSSVYIATSLVPYVGMVAFGGAVAIGIVKTWNDTPDWVKQTVGLVSGITIINKLFHLCGGDAVECMTAPVPNVPGPPDNLCKKIDKDVEACYFIGSSKICRQMRVERKNAKYIYVYREGPQRGEVIRVYSNKRLDELVQYSCLFQLAGEGFDDEDPAWTNCRTRLNNELGSGFWDIDLKPRYKNSKMSDGSFIEAKDSECKGRCGTDCKGPALPGFGTLYYAEGCHDHDFCTGPLKFGGTDDAFDPACNLLVSTVSNTATEGLFYTCDESGDGVQFNSPQFP